MRNRRQASPQGLTAYASVRIRLPFALQFPAELAGCHSRLRDKSATEGRQTVEPTQPHRRLHRTVRLREQSLGIDHTIAVDVLEEGNVELLVDISAQIGAVSAQPLCQKVDGKAWD